MSSEEAAKKAAQRPDVFVKGPSKIYADPVSPSELPPPVRRGVPSPQPQQLASLGKATADYDYAKTGSPALPHRSMLTPRRKPTIWR